MIVFPLTSRAAFWDAAALGLKERSGLRLPKAPDEKRSLAFALAQQRAFIPGRARPSSSLRFASPRLLSAAAGRAAGHGRAGGLRRPAPVPRAAEGKAPLRPGPALPGCSPASAAPAASCGSFSLGALTLFSRRDAPAGPRLPGDGRLRLGLKSNFPSSGAGGGGGNRLSRWPSGRERREGHRPQAWREPGAQNSPSRGGRGRRKSGGEVGSPPGLPVRRRRTPTVVPGRAGPRYPQTAGEGPGAVVRRAGRDLIFSCHPSVCPLGPKPGTVLIHPLPRPPCYAGG